MGSRQARYDAREFVLHLYARTCESILTQLPGPATHISYQRANRRSQFGHTVIGLLVLAAGGLAGELVLRQHVAWRSDIAQDWWWIIGGLACLTVTSTTLRTLLGTRRFIPYEQPPASVLGLRDAAQSRLREVRFQQRFSTGWSGKVALPLGAEASA